MWQIPLYLRNRYSSLSACLALFAAGMIVFASHISAAPQDQPSSTLSTRTPKVTAPAASIKPAALRPAPTRRNCGTVWTGWIDDPNADVNPCQKGCERGEQRQVKTYKTGDTTRYDVNYQCYLMVPAPRPVVASAISRKKCGTAWTGWIDDPNADVNPCQKGCEPGEQQIVDAGINGGVKKYNVRYQCYVAAPKLATGSTPASQSGIAPAIDATAVVTPPLQMTGKRLNTLGGKPDREIALAPIAVITPPLQMAGKRLVALAATSNREIALTPIAVITPQLQMTGKRLTTLGAKSDREIVLAPIVVVAPPLQMTGKRLQSILPDSRTRIIGRPPR